ncbi:MAG: SBBP repeat-containing protein [Pyrinomonadaceae bacterium]
MRNSLITATRIATLLLVCLSLMCWAIPPQQIAEGRTSNFDRQLAIPSFAGEGDQSRVLAQLKHMPLQFIENGGQVDPRVGYYVQGRDTSLYFSAQGVTFALQEKPIPQSLSNVRAASPLNLGPAASSTSVVSRRAWSLKLDFIDANPRVKLKGADATPAVINYFKGKRDQWRTGLATYHQLVYENLWPGIDLVYSGDTDQLKYTFLVKPGADPNQIKLAYRGATDVKLNEAGQLEVTTPVRSFQDQKPYSYQESSAGRSEVATSYQLESKAAQGGHAYGFRVGAYDRNQPLLIDPAIIVYAGYLGGDHEERALAIAVDNAGNAYVTGESTSTALSFPNTPGTFIASGGGQDAFVAKLNAAGTAFIYCAYIGGSGEDVGFGIAADSAGNAYVAGATSSTEASFPVNIGPDLTHNGGIFDGFVAKIDPAGMSLIYSGYIGGAGVDGAGGIAVDSGGNAYVSGGTNSSEGSFPVRVGPDLTFNGGVFFGDAFVARVNAGGNTLAYCGYIGGAGEEAATGIALDADGNAYLTGGTNSPETSFPVKVGPDLIFKGGLRDGWVAKVNTDGSSLVYCGYLGGSGADLAYDIAVDSSGSAYVSGETSSTEATFPVKVGPDLTYNGGSFDAFVAKVNASGADLAYAGYIGGSERDWAAGIAIDGAGNAYVTGASHSAESSFPVREGPDLTFNGGPFYGDAFIAKVPPTGSALVYCGYIGGENDEVGYGVAVDSYGNPYVAGETSSTEASFPVTLGPDLTYNGGFRDSFVARISTNSPPSCSQAVPSTAKLWPANHAMVPVSILGVTDPDGNTVTVQIDRITQDEPTNGTGDGDACPDAQGVGTATAKLRAERSGNGNGRVYTIFFSARDGRGGSCQSSVKVCVPHNPNSSCTEDAPKLDSTVCVAGRK